MDTQLTLSNMGYTSSYLELNEEEAYDAIKADKLISNEELIQKLDMNVTRNSKSLGFSNNTNSVEITSNSIVSPSITQ